MAAGQSLRGWVGQGMNGQRPVRDGVTYNFPPGSYTFQPARSGYWKFLLWGAGKVNIGSDGGDSGAYCEYTKYLTTGDGVALVVGLANTSDTTATFSNGRTITAGCATNAAGAGVGVATGGDVNLNGSAGFNSAGPTPAQAGLGTGGGTPQAGGGAGAPGVLPFRGGNAKAGLTSNGAGAGGSPPGDGYAIAMFVRE